MDAAHSAPRPVDPALKAYLDSLAPPPDAPQPATQAEQVEARREVLLKALRTRVNIPGLPNGVESRSVELGEGLIGRLFTPPGAEGPLPLLVYLHGGGWVAGSLATHDPFCRLLSGATDTLILSVDYRLAPEHPFPAGLEDTITAIRWALDHAREVGGDPTRIAVGGDSAGANLAAAALNRLCGTREGTAIKAQMLLYPATDHPAAGQPSYVENAKGYGLEADIMRWFWNLYAPGATLEDADVFPLRNPRLPPLPQTLLTTAQYDVLRDDGIAYAEKLTAARVKVTHLHSPDMHHCFPIGAGTVMRFPQSVETLQQIANWLKTALA
ncbi:carboxylesterase NlhH [Azorhizobium oxalatiphilum]|uniref:Carboxylesterase NlhH n=1 Tax=Azorhizobium oxalatiphilum TaxID=980631 RepID=A0A917BKG9_9HYPH|nr:alpha/beta hydrolase [Azorhizobium oxalatiphilum]GGF47379.1 carboxylesterase NlhH [Azorhizobium oxalatiphilum]